MQFNRILYFSLAKTIRGSVECQKGANAKVVLKRMFARQFAKLRTCIFATFLSGLISTFAC